MKDRRLQVYALVAQGLTNGEIGKICGIAEKTVKAHITTLHKEHHCRNRVELALKYHRIDISVVAVSTAIAVAA